MASEAEPMSKNSLKKLEKAKKALEEKRLKEEKKKAEAAAKPQKASAAAHAGEPDDDDMDPTQYRSNRLRSLEELKEKAKNPYPHKFQPSTSIPQFIENFAAIKDGEHLDSKDVAVAGMPHLNWIAIHRSCVGFRSYWTFFLECD